MIKQEELAKIPDLKTKAINYVFENVAVRILDNPSYKF